MKKFLLTIVCLLLVTTSFTQETQATESETYPSPEQLQEINEKNGRNEK